MPKGSHVLGTPVDEEKWARAKERAAEEGHGGEWDYIMGIYKRMSHSGEFRHKFIQQRKKKKQTLPEWKRKTKNWEKKRVATATKSGVDNLMDVSYSKDRRLKLVLAKAKDSFDEFRCGTCRALLFKGLHLHKSFIEVKCRSCGTFNVNQD